MYRRFPSQFSFLLLGLIFVASARGVDFNDDVAPILVARCVECHHQGKSSGGLDLSSRTSAFKGGESGTVIEPNRPDDSYLLQRVLDAEMPPESRGQSQQLPEKEIQTLGRWIAQGAKWPSDRTLSLYEKTSEVRAGLDWWSLQAVARPAVPNQGAGNPIDAFVRARLSQHEMTPAPTADRRTLVRRAYLDLHGLPPTPQQTRAFVNDSRPDAWEKLIDQLLDSPHYGERWGRHWLDVVRFAETCGYERDQLKPTIWKYRDWVIKALNDDMPFDRFVTHQLAGDEIADRNESSVIATGMIRAGTWNDEPNNPEDYVYTRLEDFVHTTTSAFLGLTVKCARCHDHKFDPIPQTDYYRIAAAFWPGYVGQANLGGPTAEQLGYDAFGWTDRSATAKPLHLLINGERKKPGQIVPPGVLSAIPELERAFDVPASDAKTTTRRLQLAKWITDPSHPLTARVLVNRLWLHHFGQGIVRTPNNFGFKGVRPTHPQLLDWLAAELVSGGWQVKPIHKLIMTSATYRQASQHPQQDHYEQSDSQNKLCWRFNRRRLDAEAMRDSMLAVSGSLNTELGGPSFFPKMSDEALEGLSKKSQAWKASPKEQRNRRSIYMMSKRSRLLPLMTTFNFSDTTLPCGQRDTTIVAPQALALLNNHFVHEQSENMARRITANESTIAGQINLAWQLVFSRDPKEDEQSWAQTHLQAQRSIFAERKVKNTIPLNGLSMWLRADHGVEVDQQERVMFWRDQADKSGILPHHASQADSDRRPRFIRDAIAKQPAIRFDGKQDFLNVAGQIVSSPEFTIIALVNDLASAGGPREVISNWSRRGRSTTSVFLGTKGTDGVRFTDAFGDAGKLSTPNKHFVLTAVNDESSAATFQNEKQLATTTALSKRDLDASYVIGTQGNYGTEWWHGDIAEILVYDRAISSDERLAILGSLSEKYAIEMQQPARDASLLALASLCHVLLNTNEFMFVD